MDPDTSEDAPNGQLIGDMEIASNKAVGIMVGNLSGQAKTDFVQTELPELIFRILSEPSGPEPEAVTITAFLKDTLKLVVWYLDRTDESVPMPLLHVLNQIFLGDPKCQKFFCSSSHGLLGSSASAGQYNGQWFKLPTGGASRFWISTANSFASYGGYPAVCKRLLRTDVPPVPLSEVDLYLTSILQKSEYTCTESFRDNELKDLLQALFVRCIHSMETDSLDSVESPPVATSERLVAAADSVLKACDKRYGSWAKAKRRLYNQWKLMLQLAMLQHGSTAVVQAAVRSLRAGVSAAAGDAAMSQFCLQWIDAQNIVLRMLSALQRLTSADNGPPCTSAGGGAAGLDDESLDDSDDDDEYDDDVPPTEAPEPAEGAPPSLADAAATASPTTAAVSALQGGQPAVALLPDEKAWLQQSVLKIGASMQIPATQCQDLATFLGTIVNSGEVAALQLHPALLEACVSGLRAMSSTQRVRLAYSTEDALSSELDCIVGGLTDTLADFAQGGSLQWRHLQQVAAAHRECDSNGMFGVLKVVCSELEGELQPLLGKQHALAVMLAVRLGGELPQGGDLSGKAHTGASDGAGVGEGIASLHSAMEGLGAQLAALRSQVAELQTAQAPEGGAAAGQAVPPSAAAPSTAASAPPAPPAGGSWLAQAAAELGLDAARTQSLKDFAAFLVSQAPPAASEGAP